MGRRPRCAAARRSWRGPGRHRDYRRHRAALWREPDRLGGGGEMAISWSRPSGDLYQIFDVAFVIWPRPGLCWGGGQFFHVGGRHPATAYLEEPWRKPKKVKAKTLKSPSSKSAPDGRLMK